MMVCVLCQFLGQVLMATPPPPASPLTAVPPVVSPSNTTALLAAFGGAAGGAGDPVDDQLGLEPTDVDRWRDALRQHVYDQAALVSAALRDLSEPDWRLSIEAVYERVQEAHGALYETLGGRRHIGAYAPGRMALDGALTRALLWQVMVLHATERLRDGEGGA